MAQDLTPQLRTRLNRVEKAVGWFVLLATFLLVAGFAYYIYATAQNRGWFKVKAYYYTYVRSADGLKVNDPVQLMGFVVGHITEIEAMDPKDVHNVFVKFEITEPYYGYLWTEGSRVLVKDKGLLGARVLEVSKGAGGHFIYSFRRVQHITLEEASALPDLEKWRLGEEICEPGSTNLAFKAALPLTKELLDKITAFEGGSRANLVWVLDTRQKAKTITSVWNQAGRHFEPFTGKNLYELPIEEPPSLNDRANAMVAQIEHALPNILGMTNQIGQVLSNSVRLTANLNTITERVQPAVSNLTLITDHLTLITANLTNGQGSLGDWIIPTNLNAHLDTTLQNVNLTITNADTNVIGLAEKVGESLDHLSDITSNLNLQVEANSNILSHISDIIVHSDEFVQGLKRHWLLRSAFRGAKTNAPPTWPSTTSKK